MNRRNFIQQSCLACFATGAGISILGLESCTQTKVIRTIPENNQIRIDLAQFEPESKALLVRTKELEYDILVLKTDTSYHAIYLQCTHENNPVNFTSKKIVCNTHGSQFDLEGKVTVGPATKRLKRFAVTLENSTLVLSLS
jgi:nitrite reductase/ring-hydroxylating ferredoxin subunit